MSDGPPDFDDVFAERTDAPNPILHVLWNYAGAYRGLLVLGFAIGTANTLLGLLPAYLIGVAIDAVVVGPGSFALPGVPDGWIPTGLRPQLVLVLLLLGGTAFLSLILGTASRLVWSWLQHQVTHDVRVDAFDAAQRLGMEFFTTSQTGDVMSVLNNDIEQLDRVVGDWMNMAFWTAVSGGAIAAVMLSMNRQLGLLAVALFLPLGVVDIVFYNRLWPTLSDVRTEVGQYNSRLEDSIQGVGTVKTNTNESYERGRVTDSSSVLRDARIRVANLGAAFWPTQNLFSGLATITIFAVGGWTALFGPPHPFFTPLSVGTFLTYFFYARRFTGQMTNLGTFTQTYSHLAASGRRVFGLIHHPTTVDEPDDPVPLPTVDGAVAFEDVSFRYPGAETDAIRGVTVDVDPGERVGIVGTTGAGKTTLLRLLVRFYDPDEGRILIDGHDVREVSLSDLRGSIGYVQQEPFLFTGTVRENISYTSPDATDSEVVEAAKQANADAFIRDLPEGYDTEIGERGVKLSGGQRQRIAIARTLLKDPDVLILDEATSHVDNATEVLIQDSLDAFTEGRTTFAIAHRLSTVRDADTILVFEDGELVESGSHDTLLEEDGRYATLWGVHVGERTP